MNEATRSLVEDARNLCQCCGKRPGKRIGPRPSGRFVCGPCLEDSSPTFEGCKHGEDKRLISALEYVQEIMELVDDHLPPDVFAAVGLNVRAVVVTLNEILEEM